MFKNINQDFFMPLASPNRFVYWDCLNLVFEHMNLHFSTERTILVEILKDYFEETLSADLVSENDLNLAKMNTSDKASTILRNLQNYGWFDSEIDKSYVTYLNLTEPAIKIFEAIKSVEEGEQVEYSSRILTVHSLIKSINSEDPDLILERIYDETRQLITELQTLNANIKGYIEDLVNHTEPSELLNVLFDDYVVNIINKAYHRLTTSDNISKVRPEIVEKLKYYTKRKTYLNKVSIGLSERKEISKEEAYDLALDYLYFVIEEFQNMDQILDDIHVKNRNYITSAINRTKFLMVDSDDIRGQLKEILTQITNEIDKENLDIHGIYEINYLNNLINIFDSNFPDSSSLYTPSTYKATFKPEKLAKKIDPKEREKKLLQLYKKVNNNFTPKKINQYVLEKLGDKNHMKLSEFPLDEINDLIKIIYIKLYGNRKTMKYKIGPLLDPVNINGFKFTDMEILKNV